MTAVEPGQRSGGPRWAALGGIAYVVLFVVGAIVEFSGSPDGDAPPVEVIRYYADSGHRDKIVLGWAVALLGVFFLLWFLSALGQWLRRTDPTGYWTMLAVIGGGVYAALTLVDVSVDTGIRTMSDDTYRHQVSPDLIHAAGDTGYVIHSAGGIGAGAMIIAATVAAARAGAIPPWANVVGIVFGVLALFSIFFFPQIAIALWLLTASVLLFRASSGGGGEVLGPPD